MTVRVTSNGYSATGVGNESVLRGSLSESSLVDGEFSSRYRFLVAVVAELDTPVTIDRLVEPMIRWERGTYADSGHKTWYDVHEELYLVDLPVLDRTGLVKFDIERGLVAAANPEE